MAISFVPNDPLAGSPVTVQVVPTPDRASSQVRVTTSGLPSEGVYPLGTPEFVRWQSREAALRTLEVFEGLCGKLPGWQGSAGRKTLKLLPLEGTDINAYYDRASVAFFEAPVGAGIVYSGASADVVAHEMGHAILDALRPDLWNVQLMEVAAFHEGFGDCIAIMLALSDQPTREALLAGGGFAAPNFVESTAEELSDAIRRAMGPNHNAGAPRRALNAFKWALPPTLPSNGPPGTLINEAHSLGQLVSGIYYDLIGNFYAGRATQADLWRACQQATRLIVDAVRQCPVAPRFLESWGRTMLAIDHGQSGAVNEKAIKAAFAAHGLTISAAGFLAPQATLVTRKKRVKAPTKQGKSTVAPMTPTARTRLKQMLNLGTGVVLRLRRLEIGGTVISEVTTDVEVDLSGLSERLANVTSTVPRPVLVGQTNNSEAVLGAVQPAILLSSAVREFVETLVEHKSIDFDGSKAGTRTPRERKGVRATAGYLQQDTAKTFEVVQSDGKAKLQRVAFACGCAHRGCPK